ncbi:sulfatase [Novosphingobium sp. 9]|uniref:sulfatase family protein n=1 Tax=Novosphingobium sp. 9 TaxID=2025349 RepID=UPI0021B6CEA0|nr:sulfatase-like hydrolase/transferase [Novosphingobium sp. 9]
MIDKSSLDRRSLLAGAAAGAVAIAAPAGAARAATGTRPYPDVIFIMADDMGYADLSITGSHHIRTPAIDSIGTGGTVLHQSYSSSPVCSASRTAIITGCYQGRFRVGLDEPLAELPPGLGLPADRPTLPGLFRKAGYRTALVGKWHLGTPPLNGPLEHGYDSFYGIVEGAADYFIHHTVHDGKPVGIGLAQGDKPLEATGYLTDLFGAQAVKEIEAAGDKPLFLSLHFNAPHWPWEGREDEAIAKTLKDSRDTSGGNLAKYAEMTQIMDENVGKVLAALKHAGREDAIVVFTSDNGGERFSETWPFVGQKGELLEGGIRVPGLVRAPGRIAAGSNIDQPIVGMDWLPTLFALATGKSADGTFDGLDLSPQLTGKAAPVARTIYWRYKANDQAAVRQGDWKYLKLGDKEHLFNVVQDERERADFFDVNKDKVKELKALWDKWNAQMIPYPLGSFSEDVKKWYPDRY